MSESAKAPRAGTRERRRQERMSLTLPVRVQGQYPDGTTWEDMTNISDASMGGASVKLSRTVLRGQAVFLSLPLPKRYRTFDLTEPTYRVYAVVCSVKPGGELGLRFLGKNPPGGYQRNDAGLFLSPPESPPTSDRRAAPRRDGVFFFVLKPNDDRGPRHEETTVADNLGPGGARIMTTQTFAHGELLEVCEAGGSFTTRASVRNAYLGEDSVWRLNLMFLDKVPPRLLAQ
jgi:PilZ domain-containing protein